eukprot:scaffold1289_cov178-Amphora_coffeaeformis.AAC.8
MTTPLNKAEETRMKQDDNTSDTNIHFQVTECATTDLSDILTSKPSLQPQNQTQQLGFGGTDFVDIVDYILKITYWIWHEKRVALCTEYYSPDCPLYTMTGHIIIGADAVVASTRHTLQIFPDRTLWGENVVWEPVHGNNDTTTTNTPRYYSSHLIVSHMTHLGQGPLEDNVWGAPTGRRVRVRTVADCIVTCPNTTHDEEEDVNNANKTSPRITQEWLMRDNGYICTVLGLDVAQVAHRQATMDLQQQQQQQQQQQKGSSLCCLELLAAERDRVREMAIPQVVVEKERMTKNPLLGRSSSSPTTSSSGFLTRTEAQALARAILGTTWACGGRRTFQYDDQEEEEDEEVVAASLDMDLTEYYDYRVAVHATNGRELYGRRDLQEYLHAMLYGLSDVYVSCDHVTRAPYLNGAGTDVAVRWTLTAIHSGTHASLGPPTQCPIHILASSHYRVLNGRVREEWTVFDELALHRQVETKRLLNHLRLESS